MACRTGCPTQDHATFGECARAANIQIDRYSLVGSNQPLEKAKDRTLERYRQLVSSGVQPEAPTKTACDIAEKQLAKG